MIAANEILKWAYTEINSTHPSSADAIACDPNLRKLFLDLVHSRLPEMTEQDALHRLMNLRRRSLLPRLHRIR